MISRRPAGLVALTLSAAALAQQPGAVDPSFGVDGVATVMIGESRDSPLLARRLPGGGMLVLAKVDGVTALVRYDAAGQLDRGFAPRAMREVNMHSISDVAVLPDDRVLLAGSCAPSMPACVVRLAGNGRNEHQQSFRLSGSSNAIMLEVSPAGTVHAIRGGAVSRLTETGIDPAYVGSLPFFTPMAVVAQPAGGLVAIGSGPSQGSLRAVRLKADGTEDPHYGETFLLPSSGSATAATMQADERLVLAGCIGADRQPFVARLLGDGRRDPSFGTDGISQPTTGLRGCPLAVAVRSGKIVMLLASDLGHVQLMQLDSDGRKDAGFGAAGEILLTGASPRGMALQADESLLVASERRVFDGSEAITLHRFTHAGIDTAFGTRVQSVAPASPAQVLGLRQVPGGGLLLGAAIFGWAPNHPHATHELGLAMLTADGALDPSFGRGGRAVHSLLDRTAYAASEHPARPTSFAVAGDGGIIAVGDGGVAGSRGITAMRITKTGELDTSFGQGGRRVILSQFSRTFAAEAVEIDSAGRVLVAGTTELPDDWTGTGSEFFVARLTASGDFDATFASNGVARIRFGAERLDMGTALHLLSDGKVLVAGVSAGKPAVARLDSAGLLDESWGDGGRLVLPGRSGSTFTARALVRRASGATTLVGYWSAAGGGQAERAYAVTLDQNGRIVAGPFETTHGSGATAVFAATLDDQDRLLTTGFYRHNLGQGPRPIWARFQALGGLDESARSVSPGFAGTPAGTVLLMGDHGAARDIKLQVDGKVLVAGDHWIASIVQEPIGGTPLLIRRFMGGGQAWPPTASANDVDGDGLPNAVEVAEGRDPLARDNDFLTTTFANQPVPGWQRLFVMQQYRDFLGREGDEAGISHWVALAQPGTRSHIIESFLLSREFEAWLAPVARLYFAYFLRIPDHQGLGYWIGRFRGGTSLEAVSDLFASSPEFAARYGALDNPAFVDRVYHNVLGRLPDAEGRAHWIGLLDGGALTRGQVMARFSESPEYRSLTSAEIFVTMLYEGMLRRAPDSAGFAHWVGAIDAGGSRLPLVDSFLASPEYRARFLP